MREQIDQKHTAANDAGSGVLESKRQSLIKSITKRLRPICSRMPVAEFDAMVHRIADIELKYGDQSTPSHPEDRAD